jgi:hypothetical protein
MEVRSTPDGGIDQSRLEVTSGAGRSDDDASGPNPSAPAADRWRGLQGVGVADAVTVSSLPRSAEKLLAGSKFPVMYLIALPAAVVAFASVGPAQYVSALVAAAWFGLLPFTLYGRWATVALPLVSAALLVATVLALPFNSVAFVVDFWTTGAMFFLSLPRRSSTRLF